MIVRLFFIFLLPFTLLSQDIMTLTGRITNLETGEGLAGANLIVIGTPFGAATSAMGIYQMEFPLNRVSADSILLSVTYIGYKSIFMFLPAVSGLSMVDFQLREEVIPFDEVVVTSDRVGPSRAYPMVLITREKIEQLAPNNVFDMLRRVPGLRLTGGIRRANISLRSRSRQPLLVIDGVPFPPDPFGGNILADILSTMNIDNVERIEIVKGQAMTYLYGQDAYNGTILIYTRKAGPMRR